VYNINLLITTFNRPDLLGNLLEQILQENPPNTIIHIHNDGSTANYVPVINKYKSKLDLRYFNHKHYGKKMYWALINQVFKNRAQAKYYIMLPDDDILNPDFFNRVINKWEGITDEKKISLMPSVNVERKWFSCWTPIIPKKEGEVYNAGYCDMRFIVEEKFFQEVGVLEVDQSRWDDMPELGSGVGSQLSNRLAEKEWKMYISEKDLTYQIEHESKMNPNVIDRAI